ncbi:Signal transduction histidine kinase [Bacteroides luti]|uniref:histidine kinase n=1 Tax=Bacteroides luti TaxID=1297750 RepID=A0A1M5DVC8_9BACE|nr:two-component regulator propeller domain-containing protein [Bacteroides luti]SHF70947.1 Signal transduction histidine kinase [Bacteroides luti]
MRTTQISIFLLFFFSICGFAQSGKLFTVDKELSSSMVNKVTQDSKGNIWIATEDGLNYYDGAKFLTFKHKKEDKSSIKSNYVISVFNDSQNNLFIGYVNGLQQYDYASGKFTDIPLLSAKNNKPLDAHIHIIYERKNGDILIGTAGHGMFLLKRNNKQAKQVILRSIPSFFITTIQEDKNGNLWIGTEGKGVFCITSGKKQETKQYLNGPGMVNLDISCMCFGPDNKIYVGSLNQGLFSYNALTNSFDVVSYPTKLPIKTLYVNKQHKIMVGTDGKGLKIYDPIYKKFVENKYNIPTFDFTKSKIHSIIEDKAGDLWLGIFQKGVMLLPANRSNFKYIGHKSILKNNIGSNCIMSVCKDHKGVLWIGTDNDGIYSVAPNGEVKSHFSQENGSNVPSTIISLFEDSDQNLWVGSFFQGLAKLNKETGHCEYIQKMSTDCVFSIVEDKSKNLWIGTMGSGIYSMNMKNNQIVHYSSVQGPKYNNKINTLHNRWVSAMLLTRNNKLYIGSFDGIGCLDLKTKNFVSTYNTNKLLSGYIIYTIFEDTKGYIWIGTSEGILCLNPQNQQITSFDMKNGLPSNVICGICGDKQGNLWISTSYGISKYNPIKKTFTNYYADDGLQGNEFSKNALFRDKSGEIIFGGVNGVTSFFPEKITNPAKKLDIRITGFYIHDLAINKGDKSGSYSIIDTAVSEAKDFHLAASDNSFRIEFSAMEFCNPERITFMYALNNDNWNTLLPGENHVSFNNLAPGKYHFKVKAKYYETYSDIKEITIIISPPWYASLGAKIIYFIIIITALYFTRQQILQRRKIKLKFQQQAHAEEINEAKLQFFMNISHEIRTPMTLIISPLQKLITIDKDEERQKLYHTIFRNSKRILALMNQLMDIRKIDKKQMVLKFRETEIVNFTHDLVNIFESQSINKQIKLTFQSDVPELKAWIDPNNYDKIILNLLSNAFKFTPKNGEISTSIHIGENYDKNDKPAHYYEIIISDSGIGIKKEEIERIFERFYQINNSQNNSNIGTGIGLHLTRSLVQLHHGKIWAENNEDGKGCRFIIRLPLGNDFLIPEEIADEAEIADKNNQDNPVMVTETIDNIDNAHLRIKTKYKVLIVEDDEEIRKYLKDELGNEFHITESCNGKEALSLILKKAPDLIISDVMMPEMDGMELCQKIKQNININHIPVILLTAKTREEDNIEGLEVGADSYITKPFSIDIVRKTIQNLIKNRECLKNNLTGKQIQEDKIDKISLKTPDEKLLERIMSVINKNISNIDFSVEILASEVGISRVHLHRKMKELTNQTTRDFIRNTRLQQAASLLKDKNQNISEVAFATGFVNATYFSTAFKELYGMSPKEYMEQNKE